MLETVILFIISGKKMTFREAQRGSVIRLVSKDQEMTELSNSGCVAFYVIPQMLLVIRGLFSHFWIWKSLLSYWLLIHCEEGQWEGFLPSLVLLAFIVLGPEKPKKKVQDKITMFLSCSQKRGQGLFLQVDCNTVLKTSCGFSCNSQSHCLC